MNSKYIISYIVLITLCILSLSSVQNKIKTFISQRAQSIESVVAIPSDSSLVTTIDSKILIDDNENPIPSTLEPVIPKPYITAESYLVANLETGEKYIDFNSYKVSPIASVSKLYTALVVHHLFDLEKDITITQAMLDAYGDNGHLVLDEKFKPTELLGALLLESSNDAAEAFAQSYGYTEFMNEMNGFAQEIGMHNTSFKDASGLSARNISSARDLFTLSQYLYKSERGILDISKTNEIKLATTTDHGAHHFININPFSKYEGFVGGKTGRTREAREAMVSLFDKKVGDKVYPIAVILVRSDYGERELNTEKLIELFVNKLSK